MRQRLQSRQVMVGIALAVLMAASLCVVVMLLLTGPTPRTTSARHATLFTHHAAASDEASEVGKPELLTAAGVLLSVLCSSVVAMVFVNGLLRRTAAREAFFLVSFLLSLSFEAVRLPTAFLALRGFAPALSVAATRLVYMGRLFGLTSLFVGTLLCLGLRYEDYAVLTGVSSALAFAMGAIVPVDSSGLTTGLIHAVSDGGGFLSVSATASVIVALGALVTPLVRQERYLLGYGAGVVCLVASRELIALGGIVAPGAGLAVLFAGTYLASRSLERVYLGIP